MLPSSAAAAPTEHKNQVKYPGCWLNQPNLSRYSKRNIFQHLKGYTCLVSWFCGRLNTLFHRSCTEWNLIHQKFFFKLNLMTWIWQQFIVYSLDWNWMEKKVLMCSGTYVPANSLLAQCMFFLFPFISNYSLWSILQWISSWSHQFR